MAKIETGLPPLGSIIFVSQAEHPAVTYPGTSWEPVENDVFFVSKELLDLKSFNIPQGVVRPAAWRRIK